MTPAVSGRKPINKHGQCWSVSVFLLVWPGKAIPHRMHTSQRTLTLMNSVLLRGSRTKQDISPDRSSVMLEIVTSILWISGLQVNSRAQIQYTCQTVCLILMCEMLLLCRERTLLCTPFTASRSQPVAQLLLQAWPFPSISASQERVVWR